MAWKCHLLLAWMGGRFSRSRLLRRPPSLTGSRHRAWFLTRQFRCDGEDPMKRVYVVCLFLLLTTALLLSQSNPVPLIDPSVINPGVRVAPAGVVSSIGASQADPKAQARIFDQYGELPLSFEVNHGQTDSRVKFLSRTGG